MKVKKAYQLYTEIRKWYFGLSEKEREEYRKHNPLLISTVELLIKLVEGGEK